VQAYRLGKPRTPTTYYGMALQATVAEAEGGRFGPVTPAAVTGASPDLGLAAPAWSRDPTGTEPAHDGTEEGLALGMAVGGAGGHDDDL